MVRLGLGPQDVQHRRSEIDTEHLDGVLRQWDRDPARADAELEGDRLARSGLAGALSQESCGLERPFVGREVCVIERCTLWAVCLLIDGRHEADSGTADPGFTK